MPAEAFIEKVDDCADPRTVTDAFLGEHPQDTPMILARRNAAVKFGIAVCNAPYVIAR